jgi:serine protease
MFLTLFSCFDRPSVSLIEIGERKARMFVQYVPLVIVKFKDDLIDPHANDSADQFLAQLTRESTWTQLAAQPQFQGITIEKLLTAVPQPRLLKLINNARHRDPTYYPPNLLTYFSIPCPPPVDPESLVQSLTSQLWSNKIQIAYIAGNPGEEPAVNKKANLGLFTYTTETDYLRAAPKGINAEYAWDQPGGDGGGVGVNLQFFDIESNWDLTHPDLSPSGPQEPSIGHVKNTTRDINHGTAVLGIVIASDREPTDPVFSKSSLGITPNVAVTKIFSYWRLLNLGMIPYYSAEHANTIIAAIDNGLMFGDVLLLEFQITIQGYQNQPGELQKDIFDAIRLATALGIVVVEAAGNGAKDLDTWPDFHWGLDSLSNPVYFSPNRYNNNFKDSGAILVSAADSGVPHTADHTQYNFGNRIDCYAWGDSIYTTRSTVPYYGTADGTSGASAIIAGAALSLQGIAKIRLGHRLAPLQIRQILSDKTTGTASPNPPNDRIGMMPDLRAIIDTSLGLKLDIYIRDFVDDHGDPHNGPVNLSPDIILRRKVVADPQAEFGESNSANRNNVCLSATATPGQDHYLYVRVRNRGTVTATNVRATVYWSDPATLVTPDTWHLIGTTAPSDVPPGDVLTVLPHLQWSTIPGTGHYCFVATIGNTEDPPPPTPADFAIWDPATAWQKYLDFIRVNNNVTWRNFDVVVYPLPPLNVHIAGAWSQAASMRLEVISRLPAEARLLMLITDEDLKVLSAMGGLGPIEPIAMEEHKPARAIRLNPNGRSSTREMMIPSNFRARCQLLVDIPKQFQKYPYEVSIRQLSRDQEVGRITWRLVPESNGDQM